VPLRVGVLMPSTSLVCWAPFWLRCVWRANERRCEVVARGTPIHLKFKALGVAVHSNHGGQGHKLCLPRPRRKSGGDKIRTWRNLQAYMQTPKHH
jgi:hypothetical protein